MELEGQVNPSLQVNSLPKRSWSERKAAEQLLRLLRQFQGGQIWFHDVETSELCGQPDESGLQAHLWINSPAVYRRMWQEGSLGAAEAYLRGEWDCDDLVNLFRILCRNMDKLMALETGLARVGLWLSRGWHWLARNTKAGSQKNIAAHYDLSNDFFQLFLDPTLMYSSACFEFAGQSLEQAALVKLERVCQKLQLKPGDHLLEIGTGWGGLAEYAVKNFGVHVTTTTISERQHHFARQRFERVGISKQVTLLKTDYRDLQGQFDHVVSIEMIEAVGKEFLPTYFRQCESLLKPGGNLVVQAILMPDHRYERYCHSVDFIQKYIFPGGHLPSVSAIQQALSPKTQLRLQEFTQFADSYAWTLQAWRERFRAARAEVLALGFDDRFLRMWDYYLCYCEGAFLEQATSVGHFIWKKMAY